MQNTLASPIPIPSEADLLGRQVIQTISKSRNPQTLLTDVAQDLGKAFGADSCIIVAKVKTQANNLQTGLWQKKGSPKLQPQVMPLLLAHSGLKAILGGAEPLTDGWREVLPFSQVLVVPTYWQSSVNGMIILGRFSPHSWSSTARESLKMVSANVAIAVDRVQLHASNQTSLQYQTLLKSLINGTRNISDIQEIYKLIVTKTAQALKVDSGWLLMLNYSDPLYYLRCSEQPLKIEAKLASQWSIHSEEATLDTDNSRFNFSLDQFPLLLEAWHQAPQPMAIANLTHFKTELTQAPAFFNLSEMPGLLLVPLMGAGSGSDSEQAIINGFLIFQHHSPHYWQTDELELMQLVSIQTSTAINHYRTLRRVQSMVDERTAQLQWSLDVQARLYETTRHQEAKLRHLNELKDEFLSTIQHELNTPLTSMRMAIENLRRLGQDPKRQAKYLDILEQQWQREKTLIQDLLKFRELENLEAHAAQLAFQTINLKELVTQASQSFDQEWRDKQLTLVANYHSDSVGKALTTKTHPDSLKSILSELLTNAGKFSDPSTTVYINAEQQRNSQGNALIVTVTNTGLGISEAECQEIFKPFQRGEGVTNRAIAGTGLGLALAEKLVHNLGGTIEVSSKRVSNSQSSEICFKLTLPQN